MRSVCCGLVAREGAHRALLPSSIHGKYNLIFLKEALHVDNDRVGSWKLYGKLGTLKERES